MAAIVECALCHRMVAARACWISRGGGDIRYECKEEEECLLLASNRPMIPTGSSVGVTAATQNLVLLSTIGSNSYYLYKPTGRVYTEHLNSYFLTRVLLQT